MNNDNSLAVVPQAAAPLPINSVAEMQTLGQVIAQSNLFGKRNPAEGLAIVAMCHQKRISWLDFMQNFHLISGVVSKKTDAILADFHREGGVHRVICRTPEKAEAHFKMGDSEYTSSISWEDCKYEPFIYVGNEKEVMPLLTRGEFDKLVVKAKYRTPRSRMQMLWARCVSDGIRVVAPECCQGVYTPEETSDFVEAPTTGTAKPSPATGVATPAPATTSREVQGVASPSPLDTPVDTCPCGPLAGTRWADMETPVLEQAMNGTNPLITPAMKAHIRQLLSAREGGEKNSPEQAKESEVLDA